MPSTPVSEQQAYLMGWANSGENKSLDDILAVSFQPMDISTIISDPATIDVYRVPNYDLMLDETKIHYWRGVFDRLAEWKGTRLVMIKKSEYFNIDTFNTFMGAISYDDSSDPEYIKWHGVNAYELLVSLYANATCFRTDVKTLLYDDRTRASNMMFKWARTDPAAVAPAKNRPSDTGYDLTVISKIKEVDNVCYYDTGIKVEPPVGYYFDVVGRSSISKTGWMLANNIGIIDASYRGTIIIALVRVRDDAEEISLPMRIAQMIPRRVFYMENVEVDESELTDTVRGEGGFGSSG